MNGWSDLAEWERQRGGADCRVCRSKPDAVAHLEASWVLIGPDDPMRGYVCLVFGRHAIELHDVTEAEGTALMRDIRRVSAAVAAIMEPVKMNYEVHGNTAPHLHVHFFPRYRGDQLRQVLSILGQLGGRHTHLGSASALGNALRSRSSRVLSNKRLKLPAPGLGRNSVCAPRSSVLVSNDVAPAWVGAAA